MVRKGAILIDGEQLNMAKNSPMLASTEYRMEKRDLATDQTENAAKKRGWRLPPWAVLLALAGAIGVALSLALTTTHVLDHVSLSMLAGGLLYGFGVVVMVFMTSGAHSLWAAWAMRLIVPLPTAALVWYGLFALGL